MLRSVVVCHSRDAEVADMQAVSGRLRNPLIYRPALPRAADIVIWPAAPCSSTNRSPAFSNCLKSSTISSSLWLWRCIF